MGSTGQISEQIWGKHRGIVNFILATELCAANRHTDQQFELCIIKLEYDDDTVTLGGGGG